MTDKALAALRARLIDDARQAYRLASVQIAAIGAFLMALLLAFPDLWASMPPEVRVLIPARHQALVPLILFASTAVARVVKQRPAEPPVPATEA